MGVSESITPHVTTADTVDVFRGLGGRGGGGVGGRAS